MKSASATPAAARDAMRERHRHGRLAAPTVRTHFPGLESLQLAFEFRDNSGFLPSPQVTAFHPPASAYFCFACPYSDCSGEFDLTALVAGAVSSHESRTVGRLSCTGSRHRGVACTLCLEYSISTHWPSSERG
ncbi:MAG TPA: hypothetical protein VKB34_20090 [Povalibacter sp.]|nr:hypothetical protein [Povalibacter sp.]